MYCASGSDEDIIHVIRLFILNRCRVDSDLFCYVSLNDDKKPFPIQHGSGTRGGPGDKNFFLRQTNEPKLDL